MLGRITYIETANDHGGGVGADSKAEYPTVLTELLAWFQATGLDADPMWVDTYTEIQRLLAAIPLELILPPPVP